MNREKSHRIIPRFVIEDYALYKGVEISELRDELLTEAYSVIKGDAKRFEKDISLIDGAPLWAQDEYRVWTDYLNKL
jgi:hypothetical protein